MSAIETHSSFFTPMVVHTRDHGHIESYMAGWYTVPGPHHHCNPAERQPAGKRCCCINRAHCAKGRCGGDGRGPIPMGGGRTVSNTGRVGAVPVTHITATHRHHHGGGGGGHMHGGGGGGGAATAPNTSTTANVIAAAVLVGVPILLLLSLTS